MFMRVVWGAAAAVGVIAVAGCSGPGDFEQAVPGVAVSASAGGSDVVANADGDVYAWGDNNDGKLGIDTDAPIVGTPSRVSGLADVVSVSTGSFHALALTADGDVYAWGGNKSGQLGDGTRRTRSKPVRVAGLPDVTTISADSEKSLAVTADGDVYEWGNNDDKVLGDAASATEPVRVPGISDVQTASAGRAHSLGVTSDGRVYAWGGNSGYQLGDGTHETSSDPVRVAELSDVTDVSASGDNSLAVTDDGDVYAWGENVYNEHAGDSPGEWATPVRVDGIPEDAAAVSAGGACSMVTTADGTVYTWGTETYDEVGGDDTTSRFDPVRVDGVPNVAHTAAASGCAMLATVDGSVYAWDQYSR